MQFKNRSLKQAVWVCGACMFLSQHVLAAGGPSPFAFSVQQFTTSDDNVSKAELDVDRERDVFYTVAADLSATQRLGMLHAVSAAGTFHVEEFDKFDGLSNTQYGLTVDYRFQTRTGFTAPRYSVFARKLEIDSETDIRDGDLTEYGFSITRKLTTKITGAFGVTDTERVADLGEVFDLERVRYFVNLDWQVTNRAALYTNYSFIDGDVFSTATPSLKLVSMADAIEPDNAFGGIANGKFAYRLDAETQILRLGMNVGLNQSASFDISADILESEAVGDIEYDLLSVTAGFLLHF